MGTINQLAQTQQKHNMSNHERDIVNWDDLIPEQLWTSLPSGGAIGRDELGPCILRIGPGGGWVKPYGQLRQEAEIRARGALVQKEAEELLGFLIPEPDSWHIANRDSFLLFRLGLDLPRAPSDTERKLFGISSFVVTGEPTTGYNCRGSAFGCKGSLLSHLGETGQSYMLRMGCQPLLGDLPSDGIVLALYEGSYLQGPHVARRLVGEWYESKCGPFHRIVHRRLDGGKNGAFLGCWLLDEQERDRALSPQVCDPIDDSMKRFGALMQRRLDEMGP